jgi:putative radical SAM enzyme (TIGR03279 family)
MPLKIKSVEPDSLAAMAGIRPDEKILTLNGEQIRDFLDLEFYGSDFKLDFCLASPNGSKRELTIYRESARPLGIIPFDYKHRNCNNHCIFCFIDQMPPGMRKTLYAKDDDYIFSFVYGNYITLTNLKEEEIQRICDQHISPLYVSLHTTNARLRQQMIRSAKKMDPLPLMRRLADCGISFHVQMVIVPGYNDGIELRHSIMDLAAPDLNVESVGLVPVGLTQFRDHLTPLEPFDAELAEDLLELINDFEMFTEIDFVYPADEFYVLAGWEVPEEEFYQDYPQIENGIGMLRLGEENFKQRKRAFLKELRKSETNYHFLCSKSALGLMEKVVKALSVRLENRLLSLQVIRNDFFGEFISVAGLITAADIISQIQAPESSTLVLPSCVFNHEGYTLDGKSIAELKSLLNRDLLVVDPLWEDWQRY